MKQRFLSFLLKCSLAILLSACGEEHNFVATGPQTLTETLDKYLDTNLDDNSPGMAILVIKDGEVSYEKAKGMANKHTVLSITSDTGFRLGSLSKTFTARAIMQL